MAKTSHDTIWCRPISTHIQWQTGFLNDILFRKWFWLGSARIYVFFFCSILHCLAEYRLNITGGLKGWVQMNSSFSQNNLDTWFASELCCCLKFSMCEEACRNCQTLRHNEENLIQGAKHEAYFLSSPFFYIFVSFMLIYFIYFIL